MFCYTVRFIQRVAQCFKPVTIKGVQTLLKAGSKAIKESATVKYVIKSTLKPTVGGVLGATFDQVASKLTDRRNKQYDANKLNSLIVGSEFVKAGLG